MDGCRQIKQMKLEGNASLFAVDYFKIPKGDCRYTSLMGYQITLFVICCILSLLLLVWYSWPGEQCESQKSPDAKCFGPALIVLLLTAPFWDVSFLCLLHGNVSLASSSYSLLKGKKKHTHNDTIFLKKKTNIYI